MLNRAENKSSMWEVLRLRDFRLLWVGETISVLGDQFYIIALPWLVLQLTGSGVAVGTVLALAGIPRAIFMIFGGVLTDRFSPRIVMLVSNEARFVLVGLLALLVLTGSIQLWMLYLFALAFGFANAFFFPASTAIVPQIVEKKDLAAGNALIQGMAQASIFLGPLAAGLAISVFSGTAVTIDGDVVPDLRGIGLAFAVDAVTFVVSVFTLWFIRDRPVVFDLAKPQTDVLDNIREGIRFMLSDHSLRVLLLLIAGINLLFSVPFVVNVLIFVVSVLCLWQIRARPATRDVEKAQTSVLAEIREGIQFTLSDHTLRVLMLLVAGINLLFGAPFLVGIPILADTRFAEGAVAFGSIMSGMGGGMLLGTILAGVLPRPRPALFGPVFIVMISGLGFGLIAIGLSPTTMLAVLCAALMGIIDGYVNIQAFTWIQSNTPEDMLGRVMSLIMFASLGVNPLAMALAGMLVEIGIIPLFVGCGMALSALALAALLSRELRRMGYKTQFGVN